MEPKVLRFLQSSVMTPKEYGEPLWNKALCCHLVFITKSRRRYLLRKNKDLSDIACDRTGVKGTSLHSWPCASCNVVDKLANRTAVDNEPVSYRPVQQPPWEHEGPGRDDEVTKRSPCNWYILIQLTDKNTFGHPYQAKLFRYQNSVPVTHCPPRWWHWPTMSNAGACVLAQQIQHFLVSWSLSSPAHSL